MNAPSQALGLNVPLTPDRQRWITPQQLARLVVELLIRNDDMPEGEKRWKISYYPYQLSSIRDFEIAGHASPEIPEFARKWNEAIAILRAKAFVILHPSQDDRADFMMPTSVAKAANLDAELSPLPAD